MVATIKRSLYQLTLLRGCIQQLSMTVHALQCDTGQQDRPTNFTIVWRCALFPHLRDLRPLTE